MKKYIDSKNNNYRQTKLSGEDSEQMKWIALKCKTLSATHICGAKYAVIDGLGHSLCQGDC